MEVAKISLKDMITEFSNETELTPVLLENRRQRILDLEAAMTSVPGSYGMEEFNEGKIKHHFATGVYARELFIPAGNVIVSKIHRGKTMNVIAKGCITVICPHKGANVYEGPVCFVSEPFTKRVVIAHTDTLWITSHENADNTENLDDVEKKVIAKKFENNLITKENL